jgi:SAM-dependent methyltransferase
MGREVTYFDCYAKRPTGEARRLAELAYRDRWRLIDGARHVLDIGFGGGGFIDAAPPGVSVRGLDLDPAAVACRPDVAVQGSAEDLPFEDDEFDAVHAAHVIEHLERPERLVSESARVLRTGGRVVVATPDLERYGFRFWVDHTHRRPFTELSLTRLLEMHAFQIERVDHGLFRQTRLEELAARFLRVSVDLRYAIRARLGRRFGWELVVTARLRP